MRLYTLIAIACTVLYEKTCLSFEVSSTPPTRPVPPSVDQSSPPVVWTSRRGMLATSTVGLIPLVLQQQKKDTNAASSSSSSSSSLWMAPTDAILSSATKRMLYQQSEAAAAMVTAANIQEYQTVGVTKVSNVISSEWIALLREGCELAQDESGPYAEYLNRPTDAGLFFTDLELGRRLPLFAAFALYGPAAAVAGTLMGSNTVRYLYDQLFVKERGVSTTTPWHQDGGYWRVKGEQLTSVFVPLDTVAPNDGLQFVTGSHTWQLHNPQHFADGTPYVGTSLPQMPDITQMDQEGKVQLRTYGLEPGDVLVFSAKTVHGGPGNWGRALSTRWVGDDGRFWDRPGEGAVPTFDAQLRDGDSLAQNALAFPATWQPKR